MTRWKYYPNKQSIKESKYRNIKTEVDGIKFDSKKEAQRWRELKILEKTGEISNLQRQVPYILIDKSKYGQQIKYIADFTYLEKGKEVVEDVKSPISKTPVYRLKKRLMAERYGIEIKEVL